MSPFFHLPSVHPAPEYVVEKVDSMLEAGDVIKQLGKELLCVLSKDSKMFQVMNQIYWVNASLKSISPVNGMVHNVPLTDFDSFEIGEPAPPAPPSPPSIPIPYGNDEMTSVWAHMMKCHGLNNPLGCPLCEKTFSGKAIQRKHIASCQELPKPRRGKDFPCHKCHKKYVDQEALDKHLLTMRAK